MDDADFEMSVRGLSTDLPLLARLLDVETQLRRWRADPADVGGSVAADALDQALGLVEELPLVADRLRASISALLRELPAPPA